MASHGHSIRVRDAAAAVLSDTTVFNYITQVYFLLGTLKKASAAAFQGTGSDPL